ncbi:MAG TPA: vWA domain-containing protein [Isosphaeraceae bacterium]
MDWLLRLLADRLGVDPARAGEAITPQLRFERAWPQGVTLLVILASAALIVGIYRREGSAPSWYKMVLAGLRTALVVLAVFMLSEAVLSVERVGLPYFVIMADDSASMQRTDQYADPKVRAAAAELAGAAGQGEPTRLAVAQGWLARDDGQLLRELQKQHKVRLYRVSATAQPVAEVDRPQDLAPALERFEKIEAAGTQSLLGTGVRQVLTELRGVPPTAIVLLTDGQTTDGETLPKAAEFAARKSVPLYTIGLGDPEPPRDLALTDLLVDDVVFVDDTVRFEAKLGGRGFAGQEVAIHLRELAPDSKDPATAKEVASRRETVPPDGQPKRVEIGHRPRQKGEVTYILEVDPLPREDKAENNRITRTINVRQDKLKVLLVDGAPRYEYRYLKNFLARQYSTERQTGLIDLNVVLLSADPEYSQQDLQALPTFPAAKEGEDGLFGYDVVLLGDADPGFLSASQMRNLVEFVTEKGGGLLFIAGEAFNPLAYKGTPLEPLLPIQLAEARNPTAVGTPVAAFRPRLTVEGRAHPIYRFDEDETRSTAIWQELPELYWFLEAPRKQPAAFVLAEHPKMTGTDGPLPLILYQFVGAGKTMFHAVDDTWRWRLRVGDRYFGRFWMQTIRFLARSKLQNQKQAEIQTDRLVYQRNQPVQVRVRFPNPGLAPGSAELAVQIERPGKGPRRLTLKASPGARNLFEGALPPLPEGEYTVRLLPPPVLEGGMPTSTFRIEPPAGEAERVQLNEPELIRAAEVSGGKFYTPLTAAELLKDLPAPQKVPLDTDPPIPLWNTWPVLALFLTVLGADWVLRKRKQMV